MYDPTVNQMIDDFIFKMIRLALTDILHDESVSVFKREDINEVGMLVKYQFYFNQESNVLFLEYDCNSLLKNNFDEKLINERIERFIRANIDKDIYKAIPGQRFRGLRAYPEIIHINDYRNEDMIMLTPMTIGYWKSISGKYVFLNDDIFMKHIFKSLIGDMPAEYKQTMVELIDTYYTADFVTFSEKYFEALVYNEIDFNDEFVHRLTEYINEVMGILLPNRTPFLTEDEKLEYMREYREIFIQYHDTPEYNNKVQDLDARYNIITNMNSKAPEIFDQYRDKFNSWFEDAELPDIESNKVTGIVELYLVE